MDQMNSNISLIIIAIAGITGCTTFKKAPRENVLALSASDYNKLNGSYHTTPDSYMPGDNVLWKHLTRKAGPEGKEHNRTIGIKMISSKRLQVTICDGSTAPQLKVIRGRWKHGYFRLRNQTLLHGVPPLLWNKETTKTRIGKLNNGSIVIDEVRSGMGMFLMFIAGPPDRYSYLEFNQTNQQPCHE